MASVNKDDIDTTNASTSITENEADRSTDTSEINNAINAFDLKKCLSIKPLDAYVFIPNIAYGLMLNLVRENKAKYNLLTSTETVIPSAVS